VVPLSEDHFEDVMGIDFAIGLDDEAGGEFVRIDDMDEVVGHNGGVLHCGSSVSAFFKQSSTKEDL